MAVTALDQRARVGGAYPVARTKQTVTVAAAGTNAETDVTAFNGLTKQIQFTTPNLDNTDTAELKLQDEDDNTLYASGELAESTTHVLNVERAICGTLTLRVECSGAQTSEVAFTVTIYYL